MLQAGCSHPLPSLCWFCSLVSAPHRLSNLLLKNTEPSVSQFPRQAILHHTNRLVPNMSFLPRSLLKFHPPLCLADSWFECTFTMVHSQVHCLYPRRHQPCASPLASSIPQAQCTLHTTNHCSHPYTTVDSMNWGLKYFFKVTSCICIEHAQVFLLLSPPKQYRLTAVHIAFTSGGYREMLQLNFIKPPVRLWCSMFVESPAFTPPTRLRDHCPHSVTPLLARPLTL